MRILYLSDHSVLEYDELQLFTDLGHDVFSCGAYRQPQGHYELPRPGIQGAVYHEELDKIWAGRPNKNDLDQRLIDWADLVIVMHSPEAVAQNWDKFLGKPVIWRSIGQSVGRIERLLEPYRAKGLNIVRYSPKEANIPGFIGEDAMIRFYKDEDVYTDWKGSTNDIVTFAQSLKGRRQFCHYDEIMDVIEHFQGRVYGPGNEDIGSFNGGSVPYAEQIKIMQESNAMIYGGTWPACYTLSFIEALMTGLPVVAISKTLAHYPQYEALDFYEVDEILAQIGGIVCDDSAQMIHQTNKLLSDPEHAKNISEKQRELAVGMFGKKVISEKWRDFLNEVMG